MFYGADVGSTYIKIVGLDENGRIEDMVLLNTSVNPDETVRKYLKGKDVDLLVATGYGRYLLKEAFNCPVISEIKAHAKGAYYFFSDVRTVIDLGGQDSKVIKVTSDGNFTDFKMNDKCAAGTGKFMEIAAARLGVPIEKFGQFCMRADKKLEITSMCAVFAESELVSLIAKGERPENIGYAVIDSVANRLAAMARSLHPEERVVFSGGGALNSLLVELVGEKLGMDIYVPEHPQFLGAFGAALAGVEVYREVKP